MDKHIAIILMLVPLTVTGCGDKKDPAVSSTGPGSASPKGDAVQPVSVNENEAPIREAVVQLGNASALAVDDPLSDGWRSEVIADRVSTQLKHLGEILAEKSSSKYSVESIVAGSVSSDPIRPANLDEAFSDEQTTVRRMRADETNTKNAARRPSSPTKFQEEVTRTLSELKIETNIRSKFKVFDVEVNGDTATTGVYVHISGEANGARSQMNATWYCDWSEVDSDHPRLSQLTVQKYEEVILASDGPGFADRTRAVLDGKVFEQQLRHGVDYWLDRIAASMGIDIGGWQGVSVGDVNGDGLDDIYICQPGGLPNRLYVQNLDGTASETSASAGVDWIDSSHGAVIVDLDNDGDQDLAVSVESGIVLMSNDGTGKFAVRALKVLPAAIPYSIAAADYDNDGDLDLLACCYNRRGGVNQHLLFARPIPYHDANNGGRNVLLRNDATPIGGKWQFRYATGITKLDRMNNRRYSYAVAWEDYDDDGDLDIYIANDFGRNNLYRNDAGTFTDVAPEADVEDIGPGMSACWGDYDNDGRMDLYVSNMFSSAGNRITGQRQFQDSTDAETRGAFRRHARGNSLFRNLGDGRFRDVSIENGVDLGRWAWGSRFADVNSDGWQDLIVANGFITQADSGDL